MIHSPRMEKNVEGGKMWGGAPMAPDKKAKKGEHRVEFLLRFYSSLERKGVKR